MITNNLDRKEILIIFISIILLISIAINASAVSIEDSTGDVRCRIDDGEEITWKQSNDLLPDIDITDISFSRTGNTAMVTMNVAGTISSSSQYFITLSVDEVDYYQISLIHDVAELKTFDEEGNQNSSKILTNNGSENVFKTNFTLHESDLRFDVWGWTMKIVTINGDRVSCRDYLPDTKAPWIDADKDTNHSNDSNESSPFDNGKGYNKTENDSVQTPGFILFLLLCSLVFTLFYLKRINNDR